MTCEELQGEYELHALGLSEAAEGAELETHLRGGCVRCVAGMRKAEATNFLVMQLLPDVAPPSRLRKRILSSAGAGHAGWSWKPVWATAMAALLVGIVWLGMRERQSTQETAEARQALAILNEPETRQIVFGTGALKPPQGRVFVNPSKGVLLLASNLPPAPAGKVYELWVIPKVGTPKSSGLFQSRDNGMATYHSKGAVNLGQTAAVAVTLEPESGSAAPTSTPVIVASLAD